jgi:sugar lactone lactonase YvrE
MHRALRWLMRLTLALAAVLLLVLAAVKLRYGMGGEDFPDRSGAAQLPDTELEVVANLPSPPGNIAVSPTGRVFVSLHPEARPNTKVVELVNGVAVPFPDAAFQAQFHDVLGVRLDAQNRFWTLDNGGHGVHGARLIAFDIETRQLLHDYRFPREIAGLGSHLNDFNVSADGQHIYIADASIFGLRPALVVYDVANRRARRLLDGHYSVTADHAIPVVQGRRMLALGMFAIRPGVDSIALSRDGEWLYYAPVNKPQLYRIATAHLLDQQLSPQQLAGQVEAYADKTMSDGISTDDAGNIYLTDPEHSAIVRVTPERQLETLLKTERLRWPDGFSFGPDGWLYVSCSSLQNVIAQPPSSVVRHAPYQVFRFKPAASAAAGQ